MTYKTVNQNNYIGLSTKLQKQACNIRTWVKEALCKITQISSVRAPFAERNIFSVTGNNFVTYSMIFYVNQLNLFRKYRLFTER